MAEDRAKTLLEFDSTNTITATDLFLVVRSPANNATTNTVTFGNLANCIIVPSTPANSTSNVVQNVIMYDSTYLYIAANTTNWGRIALQSF